MKSSCCNAKIYIVGRHFRIDPANADSYKIGKGQTYYYECDQCKQSCDEKINDNTSIS
jgi:hypothetical protein